VGSQLGQTLLKGGQSRAVTWTGLGSFAVLGLIIQTPGLSGLFGCTPLGPIGWTTGLLASATATAASPLIDTAVGHVADLIEVLRSARPMHASLVKQPPILVQVHDRKLTKLPSSARRMLRN
jgi:hypothetical protein